MFEKIRYSVIYWIGLTVLSCILILWMFSYAYTGPPGEFWNHFGDVPQIVFGAGTVLALITEVIARSERRKKKRKEENPK